MPIKPYISNDNYWCMKKMTTQPTSFTQTSIIDEQLFSSNHAEHWVFVPHQAQDISKYIHTALDTPISPMGLCPSETEMNTNFWLIQGPASSEDILCTQVHSVKNNKPLQLKHAFPSFCSPYAFTARIKHILTEASYSQAILCLTVHQTEIYAFDTLYVVNQDFYRVEQDYQVYFNAWAYQLESITADETVLIDEPDAIRHHLALNAILEEHHGETPNNLQELINQWQPQSPNDLQPIHINISKTIAYLYGDVLGQEDEAWFQGKIIGKTNTSFFGYKLSMYDVIFVQEEEQSSIIMRVASQQHEFEIGHYIRGDIWLQVNIFEETQNLKN